MKLRLLFFLSLFVATGKIYSQCFTYTVNACIDYDDHLNIRGDSLWWQDFGGSPPGTHPNCGGQHVTVNGVSWFPWNSVYILPSSTRNCTMVATILGCSNICDVIQEPTAANGWWGIYDFNDEGPGGAHPYSIQFAFFCPVVTIAADTTICGGTNANLYASGGVSYSWSPASTLSCSTCSNPVANPATATTYTVTATDANNCTGTASVTVNVSPIVIVPSSTPVSCFGGNDGSVSITVSGGNPALSYAWSNGPTTVNDPGLTSGNYTVTVTDALHCSATSSANVTQPALLTVSASTTDASCNGASDGAINLTISGGTGADTYLWNDGNTGQNRTGLTAGAYSVTVTDNNMCTATLSATISQPAILSANTSSSNVSCSGGHDGSATIVVSGGTQAYAFVWSDGNTSQNRTQLTAAGYSVVVTDAHNCTASASLIISQPTRLNIIGTETDAKCNGGNTGSIATIDTGGTSPYTWLWSDGNTGQNRNNLNAGNYSVTSTDAQLCTVSFSISVGQPLAIVITPAHVNDSCFSFADGSINLALSGGISPFTFAWNDGSNSQNRAGLVSGNYSVIATDSNTCTASIVIAVTQPAVLSVNANATPVSCYGGNNGTISLTTVGGTLPYTYTWSDGIATENRTHVATGSYLVTVTDGLLCTTTGSAVVQQPDSISFAQNISQPLCPTVDHNGSIVLSVTGGTLPYTYFWSDSSTQSSLSRLSMGNFSVTVTDANGCTANNNYTLAYEYNYAVAANPATTLLLGQSETLSYTLTGNSGIFTSVWTPDYGLSCSFCDDPLASPVQTTLYNIRVQNDSGCVVSDTVTVYVIPQYDIFIPNVFTPQNNGANQFFRIYGNTSELEFLQIKLFNRIGEKVFESNNANFSWDGTYKGTLLPVGVYVYEVKLVFIDGHTEKLRTGALTLLR